MTTWSANRRAARAVALNIADRSEARAVLDMLGLVDGGRIAPDDLRTYNIEGNGPASGSTIGVRAVATEPRPSKCTTPEGLRNLPPVEPARLRPRKPKAAAAPRRRRSRANPQKATRRIPDCGTPSGARRHQRLGEDICAPCLEARRAQGRENWQKANPPKPKQERPPCGTRGGYDAHLYRGEPTCKPCRVANAAAQRGRYHAKAAKKGRPTVSYKRPEMRAVPDETEVARLIAAGVNPDSAAILGAGGIVDRGAA